MAYISRMTMPASGGKPNQMGTPQWAAELGQRLRATLVGAVVGLAASCAPATTTETPPIDVSVAPLATTTSPAASASATSAPEPATKVVHFQRVSIDLPAAWEVGAGGAWAKSPDGGVRLLELDSKGEVKTELDATRKLMLVEAMEFGTVGLLNSDGPKLIHEEPTPPLSSEVTAVGDSWLMRETCKDHVHFKILRRVGGGWVAGHVRGPIAQLPLLQKIALSLRARADVRPRPPRSR